MREDLFLPRRSFGGIPQEYSSFEASSVVILPVPYDSTTSWRAGAREGPQAIIDASQYLELYDQELDKEVYRVGVHTLPEVEPVMGDPEGMIQRVYTIAKDLLQRGKFVIMLGGEHTLTLGMVRAYREGFEPLSVLQLDAHADLRDRYLGTKYSHACVMRRVLELCPIAQVGIRSLSLEESQFLKEKGIEPFYTEGLIPDQASQDKLLTTLSSQVYITIDLDVLDPSIMSAVGTPEPGGMSWQGILTILKVVAQNKRVVGFDLVELCPREGPVACAFLAAKLTYKLIGYAFEPEM